MIRKITHMAITLEGVQLIDVRKCDYNIGPSIRISFKKVLGEEPSTGFFQHRGMKLRFDQPLDIFKKLSFDNTYRLQIVESNCETSAQLSRVNISKQHRVFTILRIDLVDDNEATLPRQLDDDYPCPFEADKHSIWTNLMCEIDKQKKELKCEIDSMTRHLTDLRVELNKLENMEERLKNNSHSVTVLEQTYNQLNQAE